MEDFQIENPGLVGRREELQSVDLVIPAIRNDADELHASSVQRCRNTHGSSASADTGKNVFHLTGGLLEYLLAGSALGAWVGPILVLVQEKIGFGLAKGQFRRRAAR